MRSSPSHVSLAFSATDDVIVQDQDYMAQMKADILRRAQEMSQEEDDEDTGRHHNVAFEEELEDAVDGRPAFKLAGVDGEDTDDDDDEAAATAVKVSNSSRKL